MIDWKRVSVVYAKELTDHVRDRRALFSAAFGVFVGPVMVGLMLSALADDRRDLEDIRIPVSGAEHAPELIRWLQNQDGVAIADAPEDPEAAIRAGDLGMALVIDEDFTEDFASAKPARVQVVFDGADRQAEGRARRVRALVGGYGRAMANLRLIARGVSPAAAEPIDVESVEVSSAQRRAARALGFLPMMILLAAFAAGMGAAADSTAGERERGSLEALLVNPAPSSSIVAGKWMAAATLAVGGSMLSLGLCVAVISWIPLQELGLRFRIEPWQTATAALVAFPAALFAPALQMLVCSFSRSLKEAQSYLGMLVLLPMAPGLLTIMLNLKNDAVWAGAIPFYGQTMQLERVFGGETVGPLPLALAAVGTLVAAAVCLNVMTRLYRSERIIFSR